MLLFAINWKGATTSAVTQRILTVILVAVGILAMIMAIIKFDASNFQPIYERVINPATGDMVGMHNGFFTGSLAILASAPFFLAGFETIPQAVEDAEGDLASVGKTVVLSVGLACIFYALLLFCLGSAMPWQEFYVLPAPAASHLFRLVYEGVLGEVLYYVVLLGALMGLFTTWNGFMMAAPRLLMGIARGYMAPKFFAKEHPKYGTPTNGLIAVFALSVAGPFLGMGLIDPLTSFSAAGFVLFWTLTSFAMVRLRIKEPNVHRPYKTPGGIGTGLFTGILMAIVFVLLFIPGNPVYMQDIAVILFICWMALGLIVYLIAARSRNKLTPQEREDAVFLKGE